MTRFNIKNNGRKFVVFAESKEHAITKLRDSLKDAVSKVDSYKNVDIWKDETGNLYADFTIRHSGKRLADLKTKDINEARRIIERQISFLMDATTVSRWIKKNGSIESAIIRHGNGFTFYSAIIKEDKDFNSLDEAEQYAKSLGYTKKQNIGDGIKYIVEGYYDRRDVDPSYKKSFISENSALKYKRQLEESGACEYVTIIEKVGDCYTSDSKINDGIDEIESLVKDLIHNDQIRISNWTSDGKITLDSDQLYSTDVEQLCRVIKNKGYNCKTLNTRTVQITNKSVKDGYNHIGNAMIMSSLPKVGEMANKYNFGYSDSVIVDIKKTGKEQGYNIYTIYCIDKDDLQRYKQGIEGPYHYTAAIKDSIRDKSVFSKETLNSVQEGIEKDYASMRKRISQMRDELDDIMGNQQKAKINELEQASNNWDTFKETQEIQPENPEQNNAEERDNLRQNQINELKQIIEKQLKVNVKISKSPDSNDFNFIVENVTLDDKNIDDDRLSPMTYAKLKELGYSSEDWEGWTQEYANKIVEKSGKDVSEKEKTDIDRYQEYRNSLSKEELEKQAKDPDSKLGKLAEKADIRAGEIKNNELEKASKNIKRERVKENYNTLKNNPFDIDSVFIDKNKLKKLGINYSEDEEQNMYAVQDKLIELSGYKKEDFDSEGEIYSGGLLGIIAGGDELKDFSYMDKNKLDNLMSAAITIRKILDE